LFNGTHHETIDPRGYAEFTFTGTALEVYVVCPANIPGAGHYFTSFTFTLDGVTDGPFQGPQPYCDGFVYNLLAYARHNLISEPHTFRIINTNATRVNRLDLETAIVLDYAVYDDGTGSSSSSNGSVYDGGGSNVNGSDLGKGAIAGITVGFPTTLSCSLCDSLTELLDRMYLCGGCTCRHCSLCPKVATATH
jgi:hypothetical protein